MEGHSGVVGWVSMRTDGIEIEFGLDDCLLNFWKVQDEVWESLVLECDTHVLNCVSSSVEGMLIILGFLEKTVRV